MKYYLENKADVLKSLESTFDGISSVEAESRLIKNGKNKLLDSKKLWYDEGQEKELIPWSRKSSTSAVCAIKAPTPESLRRNIRN